MEFQIIEWCNTNEIINDISKFIILLFGRTKDDKTIFVTVTDFTPYFYINIPEKWSLTHVKIYINEIRKKVNKIHRNAIVEEENLEIEEKYKFVGFTNKKLYKFIKLNFFSSDALRNWSYAFKNPVKNDYLGNNDVLCEVYESNIEPMLRCMHMKNIRACGWVRINNYIENTECRTCDINIITEWTNLISIQNETITKMIIASFDIECVSEDGSFPIPEVENNKIIQIGTTFSKYGEDECFLKHIIVLGSCNPIENAIVETYENEKDVLLAWSRLIKKENPDIVTGYNIFGFDYDYIYKRCKKLGINSEFSKLSRIDETTKFVEKDLSSSAMGENKLLYYNMIGRINIDLMKYIQRNYSLPTYKLDFVASNFIKESIKNINNNEIITDSTYGLKINSYINITYFDGLTENILKKYHVVDIKNNSIFVNENIDIIGLESYKMYWTQAKDDISPNDIFDKQKGTAEDRKIIAVYCLKDCELCNLLISKLQVINNNVGMANVCSVPLSYLFMRGQGIKIFSLVSKKCMELNYAIPVISYKNNENNDSENEGYEGATVLEPKIGIHFEPIAVLDYASLYPRSMICKNLSHECLVTDEQYLNLPGFVYNTIKYNNEDGTVTTCIFAKKENEYGILPSILLELLDARDATKKKMKNEKSPFMKAILDGLQLAFKVSANSLYGSTGAKTSSIYLKHIAACTTAVGRDMLLFAKTFIEIKLKHIINNGMTNSYENFYNITKKILNIDDDLFINNIFNEIKKFTFNFTINPKIIYGDTDSVFFAPKIMIDNVLQKDKNSLEIGIKIGIIASELINKILPSPMAIEYEKTFYPFCILAKKKYVGNLYEKDPNKFYQKNMGVVLKRRDNAPIVKITCGGIVKKLLNHDPLGAVTFLKDTLRKILNGEFTIDKFIITKSLKGTYKNPENIAHAVLANRMKLRDPGNAPRINDRIPYVYIKVNNINNNKIILQGDKIEHPEYVIKNNLEIDYLFYITNQIMNPCIQFLEVVIHDPVKIFDRFITIETNRINKRIPITTYL